MWIFSKTGFVSIVKDRVIPGRLLVRARVRQDLEHFLATVEQIGGAKYQVAETNDADYRYRASVNRGLVVKAVAMMTESIDYPNFKNAVHGDRGRDSAYMRVWAAMHELQPKGRSN